MSPSAPGAAPRQLNANQSHDISGAAGVTAGALAGPARQVGQTIFDSAQPGGRNDEFGQGAASGRPDEADQGTTSNQSDDQSTGNSPASSGGQ
jgi:hypothetical protein